MTLGETLKTVRKSKGYSQEELASKCNLSRNSIYNYENDKRSASIDTLIKIAEQLEVDVSELVPDITFSFTEDPNVTVQLPITPEYSVEALRILESLQSSEDLQLLFDKAQTLSSRELIALSKIVDAISSQISEPESE